jgi:hypothetical protein
MAHVDENCFGPRLTAVLTQDNPNLPTYDDASFLEAGHAFVSDSAARIAGFVETRTRWMTTAEQITTSNADRQGTHPTFGAITASQLLLEWAFHDLGHVRQIAELLRARCYYPGIGPFQTYYTVRP